MGIPRFALETRHPSGIFACMRLLARPLHRVRVLLPALALATAVPQTLARPAPTPPPTLQPDEPPSAFIDRWNEWAYATDPDQQLLKDLRAVLDAILTEYQAVLAQYRADPSLEDLANASNWRATQAYAERIGPHTARIRELARRPNLAVFFLPPTSAESRTERAHRVIPDANGTVQPPEPTEIQRLRPPEARDVLEAALLGMHAAHELRTASGRLGDEFNYALHTRNIGLATQNIIGVLDLARLASERHTSMDLLTAYAIEGRANRMTIRLLHTQSQRLRDGALQALQDGWLAHARSRHPLSRAVPFEDRVYAELLPTWFDPEQPDRLTKRGSALVESFAIDPRTVAPFDPHGRFRPRRGFEPDLSFAPAAEQARVVLTISEAFARDATHPVHATAELESSRLFGRLAETDREGKLMPALACFGYHNSLIQLDIHCEIEFRTVLTLLGVHRHRAITGAWPATLAGIDPTVMRFDPIDPHSGQPFGYAVIDDQPTLWSAGPDRDNDDGRPIPEPPAPPEGELPRVPSLAWFTLNEWAALPPEVQAEYDGDIVLFPPRTRD